MSRRRLYFTNHEVLFICNEPKCTGDFSKLLTRGDIELIRDSLPRPFINPTQNLKAALCIMWNYSTRRLSHGSDALNAITGILNHLSSRPHPFQSLCGVPSLGCSPRTQRTTIYLYWSLREPSTRRYTFPSWSWVGWNDNVLFHSAPQHLLSEVCSRKLGIVIEQSRNTTKMAQHLESKKT